MKERFSEHSGGALNTGLRSIMVSTVSAVLLSVSACGTDAYPEEVSASLPTSCGIRDESGFESFSSGDRSSESTESSENEFREEYSAPHSYTDNPSYTVRVVAVGDILMHDRLIAAGKKPDGSFDYHFIFDNVQDTVRCADIAVVNQETILGGKEFGFTGYPSFNSPCEVGDAEVDAGFDIVLHATNHALDKGYRGIENCVSFWEDSHPEITCLGIRDQETGKDDVFITECNGIKIAFLNYTYGTNGIRPPKGKEYVVDILDPEKVIADLDKAEEEADFTIVFPHWGTEYSLEETEEQEKWASLFLEHGADVVVGTHPHVIEPIREMSDDDGHSMLVYYSIGNFINATSGEGAKVTPRMVGGIADFCIRKGSDGKCSIYHYIVIPVVCHLTEDSASVYYLSDYNEELASQNRIILQNPDFSYSACCEIVERVWGGEYAGKR